MAAGRDQWAEWICERRFAGQPRRATLDYLGRIRERILDNANVHAGDTVLDIGCGDGLVGFGAFDRGAGAVVFADISQDLLDTCAAIAADAGISDRCRFVRASAAELAPVDTESVQVATTRSVLIYVQDKAAAFREFHRVLRPGGRISLFEPINRDARPPRGWFGSYDLSGMESLVDRVRAPFEDRRRQGGDPMLDFTERDLVDLADEAGFARIDLRLELRVKAPEPMSWDSYLQIAPNPNVPTLGEALQQALDPDEHAELVGRLRPLVEEGRGRRRSAAAYLWATRD